jgi:hypothetical protein
VLRTGTHVQYFRQYILSHPTTGTGIGTDIRVQYRYFGHWQNDEQFVTVLPAHRYWQRCRSHRRLGAEVFSGLLPLFSCWFPGCRASASRVESLYKQHNLAKRGHQVLVQAFDLSHDKDEEKWSACCAITSRMGAARSGLPTVHLFCRFDSYEPFPSLIRHQSVTGCWCS